MVFRWRECGRQEKVVCRVRRYDPAPVNYQAIGLDFNQMMIGVRPHDTRTGLEEIRSQPHGGFARQSHPEWLWRWSEYHAEDLTGIVNGLVELVSHFKVEVAPAGLEINFDWVLPNALLEILQFKIQSGVSGVVGPGLAAPVVNQQAAAKRRSSAISDGFRPITCGEEVGVRLP